MGKIRYYYHERKHAQKRPLKIVGVVFIALGAFLLLYFFFPVLSYQFFLSSAFATNSIEIPIPKYMVATNTNISRLVQVGFNALTTDYTDARNWYPQIAAQTKESVINEKKVENYSISIPKLKIDNASVSTVDYDLSRHLVHYYGPLNPVQKGSSIIYGHSTLPQWFDPKNYKTIFATLHTMQLDDEIFLTVEGKIYRYKVSSIHVTEPDDIEIFSQTYDDSYLTLVTCTPPGTIWKRLIVRAKMEHS